MSVVYLCIGAVALGILTAALVSFNARISKITNPLQLWQLIHGLHPLPHGMRLWLYTFIFGVINPFVRVIDYRITEMDKGRVVGVMKQTKKNSNLYRSIHAGAMFTLAETVGAMAVFTFFGPKDRGLVTNINVDYIKIARGVLTATATTPVIKDRTVKFATSEVIITDAKSDIVAKMSLTVRTDFRGE